MDARKNLRSTLVVISRYARRKESDVRQKKPFHARLALELPDPFPYLVTIDRFFNSREGKILLLPDCNILMLALRVNYALRGPVSGAFRNAIKNQSHGTFGAFPCGGVAFWRKKASK